MFKYFIAFGILLGGVAVARADERSEKLLEALRAKVQSYKSYRVTFSATVEGEGTTTGTLTVSGRRFAAGVFGQELYYDGTTLWNYLPKAKEVTIERMEAERANVLSNPSKLMDVDPRDYDHRTLPAVREASGKTLVPVELRPKGETADYTAITLYLDPATSLPVRITIAMAGGEKPVELLLKGWTTPVQVTEGTFRFDPAAHPGTEVIDFR